MVSFLFAGIKFPSWISRGHMPRLLTQWNLSAGNWPVIDWDGGRLQIGTVPVNGRNGGRLQSGIRNQVTVAQKEIISGLRAIARPAPLSISQRSSSFVGRFEPFGMVPTTRLPQIPTCRLFTILIKSRTLISQSRCAGRNELWMLLGITS